MEKFKFGKCIYCGKERALCNDVCVDCKDVDKLPKCFEDIFGGFNDKKTT